MNVMQREKKKPPVIAMVLTCSLIALLIAYLPTMYNAFSKRQTRPYTIFLKL